jgi:hypothetical protein
MQRIGRIVKTTFSSNLGSVNKSGDSSLRVVKVHIRLKPFEYDFIMEVREMETTYNVQNPLDRFTVAFAHV